MLAAHLVPGYFITEYSTASWRPEWTPLQRGILWAVGLGAGVLPDTDVFYNYFVYGLSNHSILWTHSVFPYLVLLFICGLLKLTGLLAYLRMIIFLIALGGLSHILLDVIAHGTPLFYLLSVRMIGLPIDRIMYGGTRAYLTDALFLIEPLLFLMAVIHWTLYKSPFQPQTQRRLVMVWMGGFMLFAVIFLMLLPTLQTFVRI